MGTSMSSLFVRAVGDAMIASTYGYANASAGASNRRIEGAAMRVAYAALCLASFCKFRWDAYGACVAMDGALALPSADAEATLRGHIEAVVHERLDYADLWPMRLAVTEQLRVTHTDMLSAIDTARRLREERADLDDSDDAPLDVQWASAVQWVSDCLPVPSHETMMAVVAGAARLAAEAILLRFAGVYADVCAMPHVSRYPAEAEQRATRVDLLASLVPHLGRQIRADGTRRAAEVVIDQLVGQVHALMRADVKKYEDSGHERPDDAPTYTPARVMMSVATIGIADSDEGADAIAVSATWAMFTNTLEPDEAVAREGLAARLVAAFQAGGAYESRGWTYLGGHAAAKGIAAALLKEMLKESERLRKERDAAIAIVTQTKVPAS